jgi:hypothetical protein
MSTSTITPTNVEASTNPSKSQPASRARRLAVAILTMLALSAGLLTATEAPASAAHTGNVTFCLRYANNTAYASKPVHLYIAAPGATSWGRPWKSGTTNAQGCATWRDVPTGYYYATQGYWTYTVGMSGYYYSGWTGSAYLPPAGGTVWQATGYVQGPYRLY